MADKVDRDGRRWTAYERLAADPSASASERSQARDRLADLRARYPQGRPAPAGERRYAHGTAWARAPRWWDEEAPEDPGAVQARNNAERQAREDAVRQQRANVERVPGWMTSGTLRDLHANDGVWSPEEQQMFREQRVRLTGSSRAADL